MIFQTIFIKTLAKKLIKMGKNLRLYRENYCPWTRQRCSSQSNSLNFPCWT